MGCQQSTPVESPATAPKKASRSASIVEAPQSSAKARSGVGGGSALSPKKRPMGVGATERLASNRKKKMASVLNEAEKPKLDGSGQLVAEEIVKRTNSSVKNSVVTLGREGEGNTVRVRYAYWTQRGYYPDDPKKENQDAYGISLKFAQEDGDALFCVYDGHGSKGHHCAYYAKKKLPKILAGNLRKKRGKVHLERLKAEGKSLKGAYNPSLWPKLSVNEYEAVCRKSLVEVNKNMHDDEDIDDLLSGTTAVVCGFHFGRLTACNVGDSRVVLGHRIEKEDSAVNRAGEEEKTEVGVEPTSTSGSGSNSRLVAVPLSSDQTPYRKDERDRVRKAGADVMSMDQMEGDEPLHDNWGDMVLGEDIDYQGDPPRVWVKDCDYPGCAFTRSIGDKMADDIGVTADPEMVTCELTPSDEILVIASDGIFEFISNQSVIDLCAECASPLEACESIVKQAYNQWLTYEDRTDDITIIVCFLQVTPGDKFKSLEGTTDEMLRDGSIKIVGQKPIRIEGRRNRKGGNSMKKLPSDFLADEEKKDTTGDIEVALEGDIDA